MMHDKLIITRCESCGFEHFNKSDSEIEIDVPRQSPVLVMQEHFECSKCKEIYLTEKQSFEFLTKIEKQQFRKKN